MKRHMIISVLFVAILFCEVCPGQINSSLTLPQSSRGSSPTAPGSTYQNNLVRSSSDFFSYDQNLVVTGNVTGGRQFRGLLPYSSPYSVGVGSISPVDSFIRRSAGSSYGSDRSPGIVDPYFIPRRTASTLLRGDVSGLNPPKITFPGGTGEFALQDKPVAAPVDTSGIYRPRSMLSMSAAELGRLSGRDLLQDALLLPADNFGLNRIVESDENELPVRPGLEPVLDEMRESIIEDELVDSGRPLKPDVPVDPETKELMELLDKGQESQDQIRELMIDKPVEDAEEAEDFVDAKDEVKQKSEYESKLPERPEPRKVEPGEAKAILGKYKTFENLARAKYGEFMADGVSLLKAGKFYKAIDAFVLASVWDSRNADAYIHRAIGHFAAGEYMSGSLFVQTAIKISPEYASRKMDLPVLLGGKDVIEDRLLEAAEWYKRNADGEIAFLMAYVYYQQGRINEAQKYIVTAQEQMQENKAVALLKEAIDSLQANEG